MSDGGQGAGGNATNGGADERKLIDGRFEVLGRLREGILGPVYRVRDHKLAVGPGRAAELEIVRAIDPESPEVDELLQAYIDDFGRLEHPAVVAAYTVGRTELGLPYLASEHLEGSSVASALEEGRLLGADKVFAIGRELLDALADAHANGLDHGAITPRRVILEEGESFQPPAVRLIDFGRSTLLFPSDGRLDPSTDLFDVATLLVQMLTGELVEVAVSTPSAWRARAEALRVPEARRGVLLRALADDPAMRFPDAASFRRAIDGERRGPISERTLLTGAAVVAALGGGLIGRWTAPEATVVAAPSEADAEAAAAERERAAAAERELRAEVGRLETALAATQKERDVALRSGEELAQERDDWRATAGEHEREAERLAGEREELASANARLEGEVAAAEDEVGALERAAKQADYGFDAQLFVTRLEDGNAKGARDAVDASRLEVDVANELRAVADASDALTRARAATDDVSRAGELLVLPISVRTGATRDPSPRLAELGGNELEGAARAVRSELAATMTDLSPRIATFWDEVEREAPDRDPRPVLVAGRWFADGRLEGFLGRYADALRRVAGQEALDIDGLQAVASLEAWADAIDADPQLTETAAGAEILRLRWALRFLTRPAEVLPDVPTGALRDDRDAPVWETDLATRAKLLGEGSHFPAPRVGRVAFRTVTPEGQVSWQIEDCSDDPLPPSDATRSWRVTRYTFDGDGRALGSGGQSFRLVQVGKRFFEEDVRRSLVVDLGDPNLVTRVEAYTPSHDGDLPARLPLHAEGTQRVRAAAAVALVCTTEDGEAWFTAELGLALRESPGRLSRELVFLEGE